MADIFMDVDVALGEVPVNIMPLIDATDFKTIEDAVVFNQAGLALFWNFVTTAGAQTCTAVTPTSGGDYDWTDQGTSGMYAIEIPASGGASINNDTEGFGWFTGMATGVLPWRGPIIGFRAAALNNSLIDAGTTGLLAPTTAARTLDVSAAGNAGVDWANVEAPTTTLDLSGTTIAVTQKVDVNTIKTNPVVNGGTVTFPTNATLASTTNITAGTVTTVSGNVNGSVGSVTGAVGSVTGSVGSIATGGITTASFAAGAIDAAAIATDAIGAAEFSQAAADKVWGTTTRQLTGTQAFNLTGNITGNLSGSVGSVTGAVGSVTGNVGGNVTGSVGSVVGAVGSVTGNVGGNVTGSVGSVVGNVGGDVQGNVDGSVASVTAGVTVSVNGDKTGYTLSSAGNDLVWDEAVDGAVTARQSLRLANSANGGILSGAATTNVLIRDLANTKNRVDATVDASGNRSNVVRDLT